MPQTLLICSLIFTCLLLLAIGFFLVSKNKWDAEAKNVKRQLKWLEGAADGYSRVDILRKKRPLSEIPWLNDILSRIPGTYRIGFLLEQANVHCPVGVFVLLTLLAALSGFCGTAFLSGNYLTALICGGLLGVSPLLFLKRQKKKRFLKFERQLPDALSMLAKSLKAGHSFAAGMLMVANEFEDPIGAEFDKALNEINLGLGLDEALKNMTCRITCPDIKFFSVSVIIQRETGGNLAEILDNISHLIRERFKLKGRVRTLSAEGRFSAIIMIAIPFFISGVLFITNHSYLDILITDPIGQLLVLISLFLMSIGVIIMKRMVATTV